MRSLTEIRHRPLPLPRKRAIFALMLNATITRIFPLAAADLWAVIGDFGDTGKWTGRPPEACVADGKGVGALRTLTVQDGRVIVDRLEAEGELYYSYSIAMEPGAIPLPVKSYRATMAVAPLSADSCTFTWSGMFEPQGIGDAEAAAFFETVYRSGIAMMVRTLGL
jgi:Polyketide cyclase / dehydrase and lipid transport